MNKKAIILLAVIVIIALTAVLVFNKPKKINKKNNINNNAVEVAPVAQKNAPPSASQPENAGPTVKEFTMTSFVEFIDNKPKPQYSLKEITVNKGDKVRIKITVTKGSHNFNLDEFNIHAETPLNQETAVEFTADKVGKFIYYCSMPGHRANGHWGTLKVLAQ